ncbi:hypothetical protein [Mesorhizobium sp. YR577]|jgi:hypothetical protein|uniref:hypothetical protein n=1 Tax=Mesorhizobium sp. YR577 TaxID=1884373 RepID=UPI0008E28927|nr:hypothetical protein [Mesorhizobium sp. YR577]SFU05832.1 hypothetical protein SAMN05518861_11124 [Mesorhizobium sp. YR577]
MIKQPHASTREIIVANSIQEVVSELRLVDVADYIAFIRLEQFGCISDIVDSAAELFFMPGTLRLGHGGEAHVGWSENPRIVLDLELRPAGATVYFALTLTALHASVEVNYVAFDMADEDPEKNTAFLEASLEQSRIRKTVTRLVAEES